MADQQIIASSTAQQLPGGKWEATVPPLIPEGLHTLVVSDDRGGRDEALLFVDRPSIVDRITHLMPPVLGVSFLFFLAVILLLAANTIRLAKAADAGTDKSGRKKRYLRHALYLTTAIVVMSLIVGLAVNQETSLSKLWSRIWPAGQGEIVRSVSGAVHDINRSPVMGAVLVGGETMITTSESGMYMFSFLPKKDGIHIAHPDLSMAINKEVRNEGKMDILLEIAAMQSLIDIARLEAGGDIRTLYKQLFIERLKNGYSQDIFMGAYKARFTQDDVLGGILYVGDISKLDTYQSRLTGEGFTSLIRIEVFTGSGTAEYLLTNDQGKWKLVF
jgi:hypothetical protein